MSENSLTPPPSEITFSIDDTWFIKLTEDGVKFNRDAYPNDNPDDFAMKFIEILESKFNVKFIKKENDA
jgi:hypothetical protein